MSKRRISQVRWLLRQWHLVSDTNQVQRSFSADSDGHATAQDSVWTLSADNHSRGFRAERAESRFVPSFRQL